MQEVRGSSPRATIPKALVSAVFFAAFSLGCGALDSHPERSCVGTGSATQQRVHLRRCVLEKTHHVRVGVHRHADLRMAQRLHDDTRVNTLG